MVERRDVVAGFPTLWPYVFSWDPVAGANWPSMNGRGASYLCRFRAFDRQQACLFMSSPLCGRKSFPMRAVGALKA
jgi:hypothetical protein